MALSAAYMLSALALACAPPLAEYMDRKPKAEGCHHHPANKRNHRPQMSYSQPISRRRNLSVSAPLPAARNSRQRSSSNPQEQCRLLTLPLELREKIYGHVFGRRQVHVAVNRDGTPVYYFCKAGERRNEDAFDVWFNHDDCFHDWDGPSLHKNRHSLTLLQTCRRLYGDAITTLYATTTFKPADINSLFHLESRLLPQRLHIIRTLELKLSLNHLFTQPDDPTTLNLTTNTAGPLPSPPTNDTTIFHPAVLDELLQALDLLAGMRRLRDLRIVVRLRPLDAACWLKLRAALAERVAALAGLRRFEIVFFSGSPTEGPDARDVVLWGGCRVVGTGAMVEGRAGAAMQTA